MVSFYPMMDLECISEGKLAVLIAKTGRVSVIRDMVEVFAYCGDRAVPLGTRVAGISIAGAEHSVYINSRDRLMFTINGTPRAAVLAWLGNGADDIASMGLPQEPSTDDKLRLYLFDGTNGVEVKGHVSCFHYIQGRYVFMPEEPVRLAGMEKPASLAHFLKQLSPVQ